MAGDDRRGGMLRGWLAALTAPSARLQDAAAREQSTVLSRLLLFMLFWLPAMALLLRFVLTPGAGWRNPELVIALVAALALLLAFALNRRGYYLPAALLTVMTLLAGVFAGTQVTLLGMLEPYYPSGSVHILAYLLLPLVLGAILLPVRLLAAILLLAAAGVAAVPAIHPHVGWAELLQGPLSYVVTVGILVLFLSYTVGVARRRRYHMVEWREQRYRSLFEQSPDAMFLVAADGTIETINSAGLVLFGYERAELEGGSIRQLYAVPDERAALIAKTERHGVVVDEPLRMRRKDGAVLDCLVNIRLRTDPDGRVAGYQTVVRDVTAQLRVDEELRLKGQMLDLAHDVVLLVDPGGEIVYANEAGALLTGYPIAELVGMNIRRLNTPEGAEQVPSRISAMMREGEYHFDTVWVCRDGRHVDIEVRTRTVQSRGRTLFLSVARDITRRKFDEAELRLRSELLDLASDAVLLHDYTGKLLYVNQAAAQQTGYTRSELLGMSLRDLDDEETSARMRTRMAELMNRRAIAFEGGHRRKDGVVIPVDVRARIVEWEDRGIVLSVARDISERKKSEAALQASEERFRSLFEQSIDAIFGNAPDGSHMEANQAWLAMFGYSRADLAGMNAADLYARTEDRHAFVSVMREQGAVRDEVALKRKDGTVMLCQRVAFARRDPSGRVVAYQGIVRDITAQRKAERELRESEEKYRALVEQSLDAIWTLRPDGTGHEVNQAWLDMFGYTREDLPALHASDLYADPADRQVFLARIAETGSVRDEVRFRRKDGTELICERTVVARRDDAGRVVAFQGVSRDVTADRAAEERLRQSEERYRALFEQSMDAIYISTPDGATMEANQAWLDLFGYTREELGQFAAIDLYADPADRARFLEQMAEHGAVADEVRYKRRDGTVMDVQRAVIARKDARGKVVTYQGVMRDITARKQAERLLRESEERYRTLFERSLDAVCLVAADGRLLDANPAYLELFGYSPEDVGRVNVRDRYVHPEERDEYLRQLERDGAVTDRHTQLTRTDGTVMDCVRSSIAYRDESGRIVTIQTVTRDVTEWLRAQEALRRSEEKYRALFEQSMDAVAVYAVDGTLLDANPAHLRLFKLTQADIGLKGVLSLYVNPADRTDFLRRVERDGAVVDQELRLRTADGVEMDCVRSAVARRDAEGRLVAVQTVTRDVTERRRAELELRQSEERYRTLFEQSMDAVALVAVDGTLQSANPAYLRLFGHSAADIGKQVAYSHYPDPEVRAQTLRLVEREGVVLDQEVRLRKTDGTEMDCVRTLIARRDGEGRLIGLQSVTRDITARKRAEQELRESEARYRALVEHPGVAMTVTSLDGQLLDFNDAFAERVGYSRGELLGTSVTALYARPEEREALIAELQRTGHVRGTEVELRRKDGASVFVSLTMTPVTSRGREVIVAHGLDVTERRHAELELVRSREELKRSAEQLHELAIYLEEAREKERTGIARELHDQLGQALTALRMDLDGIVRVTESGGAPPAERLGRMASLLDETVDDVRRISSELRPGILDDAGLVAALEWQLDRFRERSGLECALQASADDAGLDRASSTALFRVFQELLTNVARHAGASSVLVTFERRNGDCVLSVSDDGRGITVEEAGSAASLGIVGMRQRLRPLHGSLEFEPNSPLGTTARVRVPLSPPPAARRVADAGL